MITFSSCVLLGLAARRLALACLQQKFKEGCKLDNSGTKLSFSSHYAQPKTFAATTVKIPPSTPAHLLREGCKKSKWKFKMAFAFRRPTPPLNGKISRHFFNPLFFFCNWILHIWNGFYTSKISLLSSLIIGSKLTFISSSGRWLPTIYSLIP